MEAEIKLVRLTQVLKEYAERYRMVLKRNILENDNVATGNLFASIASNIVVDGYKIDVEIEYLKYLDYLEDGTKPFWPPVNALVKWVKDKKLPTRNMFPGAKNLPTENQLAFLVGRKISEVGIQARHNIANTQAELDQIYEDKFLEAFMEDLVEALPVLGLEIRG